MASIDRSSRRAAALAAPLLLGLWLVPAGTRAQEATDPGETGESGENAAAAVPVEIVDGIAAQVGTDVVLMSDVTRLSGQIEERMREAGATDADVATMRAELLDRLIDRTLISLFAKRNEIQATEAEIDEAMNAVASENQMTIEQMRQSVESEGLTWDAYRKRLGDEVVQSKVLSGMVGARIRIEEDEIRKYYDERFGNQPRTGDEVHLQHIAVASQDDEPASKRAACDRVRSALGRIRAGQDFLDVARDVSEGTPDLGFVAMSNLAPWMAAPVDQMQPGGISDVIELPVGCAVLRLVERREIQPVSFEQAAGRIQQVLKEERYETELESFLERLRKQTYVERKGVFASGTRTDASSGAGPRLQ